MDDTVTYIINITNNDSVNFTNYKLIDVFNYSWLNYTNSSILPSNVSAGQVEWILNITTTQSIYLLVNFTALQPGSVENLVFLDNDTGNYTGINSSVWINITPDSIGPINITLTYPPNGSVMNTSSFTLNYTVNIISNCTQWWNVTGNWSTNANILNAFGDIWIDVPNLQNGFYLWNVFCVDKFNSSNNEWGSAFNWTIIVNATSTSSPCDGLNNSACNLTTNCSWDNFISQCGMDCQQFDGVDNSTCQNAFGGSSCIWDNQDSKCMPKMMDPFGCAGLDSGTCGSTENCTWEDFPQPGMCILDCFQFDQTDNNTCETGLGVGFCKWDPGPQMCDPFFFDKGFDGFSFCFGYDGNKTACDNFTDDCVWFSEPNCPDGDWCEDKSGGTEHGFCDPKGMSFFGGDCGSLAGNKTACNNAGQDFGWDCKWDSNPLCMSGDPCYDITGVEHGFCIPTMGGGGGGCWDNPDEESCNASADKGMPCDWMTKGDEVGDGWCGEKGCWEYDYTDSTTCESNIGCKWNDPWCDRTWCGDFGTNASCTNASTLYDLDCSWATDDWNNSWCEEDGCWNLDWNQSGCEAKEGCSWNSPWCEKDGCWNFDGNETACGNNSITGLNCFWETDAWGWCEQQGCWAYDGQNQSACENNTAEMPCLWDNSSQLCFDDFKKCDEIIYMNECFDTGWCFWEFNETNGTGTCKEPIMGPQDFFNPDCWVFNKVQSSCQNVTVCNWTGSSCDNLPAIDSKGVQCQNINNSKMCNGIPMLSSCCSWNGTGCEDAPYTTACWDNMPEPPEGGHFCDDYIATSSKATCEQIAGDPWYMPCEWDNQSDKCQFAFDDMFGGKGPAGDDFDFQDIGSKANCEAIGGKWISEKWTDSSGSVYTDEWCEMGFGIGYESCDTSCWACEFQSNGSTWNSTDTARSACEGSGLGNCIFRPDNSSFNSYGWCDMDWSKSGNCEQNCWECWDEDKCTDSVAGCKWFTDPWNDNNGWCDGKNVKTCNEDCYMCWDPENCGSSDAGCSWDTNYWFCKTEGTGLGGESSEICFDGVDNDADTFIDCADAECMFKDFCGGSEVFGSNCPSIPNFNTCNSTSGCVWITDQWNNSWCDMEGAQCWMYDDNATVCGNQTGCSYMNMSAKGNNDTFCDINFTIMDNSSCWNYLDKTSCQVNASSDCVWVIDKWCIDNPTDQWCGDGNQTGWCDHKLWSCHNYDGNETACDAESSCGWITDWFNPDFGWCDPVCFSRNASTCTNDVNLSGTNVSGVCDLKSSDEMGWCEPDNMFSGCWQYDNNQSACDAANVSCVWMLDPYSDNGGFCGDKFMFQMVGDMDPSPPLILGTEDCPTTGEGGQSDICGFGLKDDFDTLAIGTMVSEISDTAACQKFNSGSLNRTSKFYWYLDTDGAQTGGCSVSDNQSLVGFEFKFKYTSMMQNNEHIETKVAYKCLNGTWSPSQIKLTPMPDKMCNVIGGGVIAVGKEDLKKLKVLGLYNESANMRIYATTAGENGSDANVSDTIGPEWYSHGSADFKFEDCSGFEDKDGDGFEPSDDPDCVDFLRYGYIDYERGQDCQDNIDNDGNGLTDCSDPGCMYDDMFCDSSIVNDTTAPKITWLDTETFTDGAFVMVDTDEPTNATLAFYGNNNSYCINATFTLLDMKLNNSFDLDDYDVWHDFPVDNIYFTDNSINYNITTNTTYYYKLKLCDKLGNCALSACLDFTTKTNTSDYTVGFGLPTPKSDVTEPLGTLQVGFDIDGDGVYNDSVIDSDKGIRINDTEGRNVDIKFYNPNSADDWAIYFLGADLLKALSIDITSAFIVNSSGDTLVGMDSDKWKELAQKLGVDTIKVEIPIGIASGSTGDLYHCPDNATSLTDTSCVKIDLTDVECNFTTTKTTCTIPVSIGFSVFGVKEVTTTQDPEDDSPGGSSSTTTGGSSGSLEVKNFGNLTLTGVMDINNTKFSFTEITVNVDGTVENAKLYAEKKTTLDDSYPEIDGTVYQYQKLSGANIEAAFEDGEVKFKVEKSWMTENNVTKSRIFLLRYNGNNWVEEPVTELYSEEDYVYYKATFENLGMFAVASLSKVGLDYIQMSDLVPELIDKQMVIESGLSDALMIDRIESYLFGKMNIEKTIEQSKELVKDLDIKREVKATGNSSTMTVTIKNNRDEPVSFIFVEAVPKSIVHDVYALKGFVPRKYDFIIREDPVIQWSFGEADTSIVAWEVKNLGAGDTATFSYTLDAKFEIEKYPAPIIIMPFLESGLAEAAEDGGEDAGVVASKFSRLSIWLSVLVFFAIMGLILSLWWHREGPPGSPAVHHETRHGESNLHHSQHKTDRTDKEHSDTATHHTSAHHQEHHHEAPHSPARHEEHKINKIADYIHSQHLAGRSEDEIKKKLKDVGWDQNTINKAMHKHKNRH